MSVEAVVKWLDKYTRGKDAKGDAGGLGVARKIDKAFTGAGQKYSNDPNSRQSRGNVPVRTQQQGTSSTTTSKPKPESTMFDYLSKKERKAVGNAAIKRAAERRSKGETADDLAETTARYKREGSSYKRKAKDKNMQDSVDVANYRKNRINTGQYKGKYYGPDAFKGDMEKLKAWRKAGSPKDKSKFV